jgi:hypothetical protein
MNIFKSTTFTWKQISLLKWSVFLIGIAAGAYWADFFAPYTLWLLIVGLVLAIYPAKAWFRNK